MHHSKRQTTIRRIMTRIAFVAVALGILVAGARESARYHCGNPLAESVMIVTVLVITPPFVRAMARAYQ